MRSSSGRSVVTAAGSGGRGMARGSGGRSWITACWVTTSWITAVGGSSSSRRLRSWVPVQLGQVNGAGHDGGSEKKENGELHLGCSGEGMELCSSLAERVRKESEVTS